jgi:hypothetical protein
VGRIRQDLVPLNHKFSYFLAGTNFGEEDLREYLSEPVAALPPSLVTALPNVYFVLVPYLDRPNGKEKSNGKHAIGHAPPSGDENVHVSFEIPPDSRRAAAAVGKFGKDTVLAFSVQDQEVADYHHHLYHELAKLLVSCVPEVEWADYMALLREELTADAHGEVDDDSWRLKQGVRRRQGKTRRMSKGFNDYAKASLIDTLALYLHGICCDIDVEPGPRQLPSNYLRKRLKLLTRLFPAPKGYAVFPEDLDRLEVQRALPPAD